jgi:Na+-translocating ferredoxin:NAD+ oxidoreductase RnfD subunit
MAFASLKQKLNIKYFMMTYLTVLFISAVFFFAGTSWSATLLKGLAIVLLYVLFDLLWTYLRDKTWYLPVSSVISGFVLAIVASSDLPIHVIVILPLLAVFSKQFLHFGKMRHVFNPAAFALAIMSLFLPTVTWWATGWSTMPLIAVAVISLFVFWRQGRWHVAIPFLFSYSILLTLFLIVSGVKPENLAGSLNAQLVNGTVLFFTAVMLIEPLTSTFPARRQRVIYALLVAVFAIGTLSVSHFLGLGHQDPLILGLLAGDITASLLFLPKRKKVKMSSDRK